MRTATELEAHVAAEYSVVLIGATLAAGLGAGMFWHTRESLAHPRRDFDASFLGGLILALAIAWLGLILLINGLEAYRGWLVANFVCPPALTRLLVVGPVAIGLAAVGLLVSSWSAALYAWQRAFGQTNGRPLMLWVAIALGLVGGFVVSVLVTRVRVVELLALLASFGAGLVAGLGRAPARPHQGEPRLQPAAAPSVDLAVRARQAVGVTVLALWIGWTAGSAFGVLPGSWSGPARVAVVRQTGAELRALVRSWHPDAVFVSLAGPDLEPDAIAAGEADLPGARASVVVITDIGAGGTLVPSETAARSVRRAARALLRGGLMLVESENVDVLAAVMDVASVDEAGRPAAYVLEFRTPSATRCILAVGRAVPEWLATRPLPEGATAQLHPVYDATAAKHLLERY